MILLLRGEINSTMNLTLYIRGAFVQEIEKYQNSSIFCNNLSVYNSIATVYIRGLDSIS